MTVLGSVSAVVLRARLLPLPYVWSSLLVLDLYSSINFPGEYHVPLRVLFLSSRLYLYLSRSEIRLPLLHQSTLDQTSTTCSNPSRHLATISRPPSRTPPAGYTSPNALTAAAREISPLKLLAQESRDSNPRQISRPILTHAVESRSV